MPIVIRLAGLPPFSVNTFSSTLSSDRLRAFEYSTATAERGHHQFWRRHSGVRTSIVDG
jgi:hypothetical protein